MQPQSACPECGLAWQAGETCEALFHQMLFWENEQPDLGAVHHLMVLSYHLQHPGLFSQAGLDYGVQLLKDFLEGGLTPQQARQERRREVDSGQRTWKLRPEPEAQGAYPHPLRWKMTAADVVRTGAEGYIQQVQMWANCILTDLRYSGNLG
jgi:hypothetical protein